MLFGAIAVVAMKLKNLLGALVFVKSGREEVGSGAYMVRAGREISEIPLRATSSLSLWANRLVNTGQDLCVRWARLYY